MIETLVTAIIRADSERSGCEDNERAARKRIQALANMGRVDDLVTEIAYGIKAGEVVPCA